jgi:hypothetical protein
MVVYSMKIHSYQPIIFEKAIITRQSQVGMKTHSCNFQRENASPIFHHLLSITYRVNNPPLYHVYGQSSQNLKKNLFFQLIFQFFRQFSFISFLSNYYL